MPWDNIKGACGIFEEAKDVEQSPWRPATRNLTPSAPQSKLKPIYHDVTVTRVAKFWKLSINSLVFQKSMLEDFGFPAYSFLISGILRPGFRENQGIY
jgi:hypothetical protein